MPSDIMPRGLKPKSLSIQRIGVYCFLFTTALFFLMPLYVMIVTSLKDMEEIRGGNLLYWPQQLSFYAWPKAWRPSFTSPILMLDGNGAQRKYKRTDQTRLPQKYNIYPDF